MSLSDLNNRQTERQKAAANRSMVEARKSPLDPQKIVGFVGKPYENTLTYRDACLYALSIGIQADPMNTEDMKFTYEADTDFEVFPTQAAVLGHRGLYFNPKAFVPSFLYDTAKYPIFHTEEHMTFYKSFSPDETYVCEEVIPDLKDKGKKGALKFLDTKIFEKSSGDLCATIATTALVRNMGGFGYKGSDKQKRVKIPKPPQTAPDFVAEEPLRKNIANLYRLNGDKNPFHVIPKVAAAAKFDRPIMHGLCTYSMSVRSVQKKYSPETAQTIHEVNAKFSSHVYPGETLQVEMWKQGNTVLFATKTKERGLVAQYGYVTFKPEPKL